MKTENDLLELLENEQNIIVYGAGYRAQMIIQRMQTYDLHKAIYIAVSKTHGTASRSDIAVQNLSELKHLADSSVLLIATMPRYHDEMEEYAKSLGFHHIARISNAAFCDIKYHYNTENIILREQKKQRFFQYQTMNLIRLNNLREKVHNGKKINVMFVLTDKAKFNFASVYWEMEKNPLFEVSLFVFEDSYGKAIPAQIAALRETQEYAELLKQQGYNVIWGHDANDNMIPLETYPIDIIFYNVCYPCPNGSYLEKAVLNHLSCYMSYGMLISRNFSYHFENERVLPAWLFLAGNRHEYSLSTHFISGNHMILSGHPLFDDYKKDIGFSLPTKLKDKKKIIIYAPHWSMDTGHGHNISTFHIIGNYILSLLKEYPDIGFVFKPHPRLDYEINMREATSIRSNLPSYAEWLNYCDTWENSPNGVIVTDSSYIHWFKNSDCLITDSYSFILAWLPTERPCIYLQNPQGPSNPFNSYLDHVRPVLESYYLCDSQEKLKELFKTVIIDGRDDKAEERKRQKDDKIYNLGHAGEFITDYIEQKLKN